MEISKEYRLPFPRQTVFDAWVSSDTVIAPATSMDVLPEVGGHYRLLMEADEFTGRNEGTFSLVDSPSRVVYTWEWNGDGEVTEIDVTFAEDGSDTLITLQHRGFKSEESRNNHDSGWDSYIDGFTQFLASR